MCRREKQGSSEQMPAQHTTRFPGLDNVGQGCWVAGNAGKVGMSHEAVETDNLGCLAS